MSIEETLMATFQERYGETPTHIVRAPGRVNLLGEHVDYNDGFVLPIAIDRRRSAWKQPIGVPLRSATRMSPSIGRSDCMG